MQQDPNDPTINPQNFSLIGYTTDGREVYSLNGAGQYIRGENGYEAYDGEVKDSLPPQGAPTPPPTPGGGVPPPPTGGGGGGGGTDPTGGGAYPPWSTPFVPPSGPPDLSFIPAAPTFDFTAPTPEQAAADPGYRFITDEGRNNLEQSAAGHGALNTSGTLKDILNYGQAAATTQYRNVYDRTFNLAQAKFNPLLHEWDTLASAGQRESELDWDRAWQSYLQHYREYTDWANADWTRKYQAASL